MKIAIYVVEIYTGRRWEPTVGVALSRVDARATLRDWKARNSGDRFRLTRYYLGEVL